MPNILMVGPDSKGGMTSVVKLYLKSTLKDSIKFISTYSDGNLFIVILNFSVFLLKFFLNLLFDPKIKIVHAHSASKGSFVRKAIILNISKFFGKKVIFHLHGAGFNIFYQNSNSFMKKFIKNTLDKVDSIIVLSEQWAIDVGEKCNNKNIKVLYNPTIIRNKSIEKNLKSEIKIVSLGRIGKRKGSYDIIEAVKLLKTRNVCNIKISLYGDGEVDKIQSLINKNDIENLITVSGWITSEEKDVILENSHIYLLPSYNEGLPMSILEAFTFGLPVISTPVGGIPEIIKDGINGFLVTPGDHYAIADKIQTFANDIDLINKMGQENFILAKEKFDLEKVAEKLKEIYDGI